MESKHFKNIIIGFGKAGRALAKTLAQNGETVALIERDKSMYGGTCPNVGCAPSKMLITAGRKKFSFTDAMAAKHSLREVLHNGTYHSVADQPNATILDGVASFVDNKTVDVNLNGAVTRVTGERIFINTGATPVIPNIDGVAGNKNVLTSRSAMELDKAPKNLVIIGAGAIGLEFAGMFSAFGTKVTVIESGAKFMPKEDRNISELVMRYLTKSGIEFVLDTRVEKVSDNSVTAGGKVYPADKILIATGRAANTEDLKLKNAGVELQPSGHIKVDDKLKTTAENIRAMGDVRGGQQFYYLSTDDYRIVANQLFGDNSRTLSDRTIIPYSVYITPPLSRVGLNESEAQDKGEDYLLFKMRVAPVVRARIAQDTRGVMKALADKKTGKILGATLYHEDSHELINLIALAMKAGVTYRTLRDQISTHPSMGEALNDLFSGENIQNPESE